MMAYRESARVEEAGEDAAQLARRMRLEGRLRWAEQSLTGRVTPLRIAELSFYPEDSLASLGAIPFLLLFGCFVVLGIGAIRTIPAIVRELAERGLYGAPIHRAHGSKAFLVLVALSIPAVFFTHDDARIAAIAAGALVSLLALFIAATNRELVR